MEKDTILKLCYQGAQLATRLLKDEVERTEAHRATVTRGTCSVCGHACGSDRHDGPAGQVCRACVRLACVELVASGADDAFTVDLQANLLPSIFLAFTALKRLTDRGPLPAEVRDDVIRLSRELQASVLVLHNRLLEIELAASRRTLSRRDGKDIVHTDLAPLPARETNGVSKKGRRTSGEVV